MASSSSSDPYTGKASYSEEDPLLSQKNSKGLRQSCATSVHELTICKLASMIIFFYPFSFIWATMGMVVLPAEALRLFPTNEAFFLSLMMSAVAFAQLVCPLAGSLSDQHRSTWGKRRPFIFVGTIITVVSVGALWITSELRFGWTYILLLFLSQCAVNVVYTAQAGIIPDNGIKEKGYVSGIISTLQLAGTFSGMIWLLATHREVGYNITYPVQMGLLISALAIACQVQERPTNNDKVYPFSWQKVLTSFWVDLQDDRDFFWVLVGRTFFYAAQSCNTFTYYYFRDMMNVHDENRIRFHVAVLGLTITTLGFCSSYPMGKLSDHPAVGRKKLIYFSCFIMSSIHLSWCLIPTLYPGERGLFLIYVLGGVYGVGFAGYLSVDYALALDTLPKAVKGTSEALGLWGTAAFVGSMVGPLLASCILESHHSDGAHGGYTYRGWVLMLGMCMLFYLCSALVTSFIKRGGPTASSAEEPEQIAAA